mgnify:FL=1
MTLEARVMLVQGSDGVSKTLRRVPGRFLEMDEVIPDDNLLPVENWRLGKVTLTFQPFMHNGTKYYFLRTQAESAHSQLLTREGRQNGRLVAIN